VWDLKDHAEDVGMKPIGHDHAALGQEVCSALNAFPCKGLKRPVARLLDFSDAPQAGSRGFLYQLHELL
jgi:hypothetical protein